MKNSYYFVIGIVVLVLIAVWIAMLWGNRTVSTPEDSNDTEASAPSARRYTVAKRLEKTSSEVGEEIWDDTYWKPEEGKSLVMTIVGNPVARQFVAQTYEVDSGKRDEEFTLTSSSQGYDVVSGHSATEEWVQTDPDGHVFIYSSNVPNIGEEPEVYSDRIEIAKRDGTTEVVADIQQARIRQWLLSDDGKYIAVISADRTTQTFSLKVIDLFTKTTVYSVGAEDLEFSIASEVLHGFDGRTLYFSQRPEGGKTVKLTKWDLKAGLAVETQLATSNFWLNKFHPASGNAIWFEKANLYYVNVDFTKLGPLKGEILQKGNNKDAVHGLWNPSGKRFSYRVPNNSATTQLLHKIYDLDSDSTISLGEFPGGILGWISDDDVVVYSSSETWIQHLPDMTKQSLEIGGAGTDVLAFWSRQAE